MNTHTVRHRGQEYPVLRQFQIRGRLLTAVAQIKTGSREAYRVLDRATCQWRALHVFPDKPKTQSRLRTLQRLTHGDNEIVQILDVIRDENAIYVLLPWVNGFDLNSVRVRNQRRKQRISLPEAVRLMKGVAHATRHLHHGKNIIHGDIKPSNLILTPRTSLVLIDFGSAWPIERTLQRDGGDGTSLAYAAPELARGDARVDWRADQFSIGVVLYELLTDRIPYGGYGGGVGCLPERVISDARLTPPSESSPERNFVSRRIWKTVDHLADRSLALDPNARFATQTEWLDAWTVALTEIRRTKQIASSGSMLSQMATTIGNWITRRL